MRAEERQVDGLELDHLEQQEEGKLAEKDGELPEIAGEEVVDIETAGHDVLLELMHQIFDRKTVNLGALSLPKREQRALEALQSAVAGRLTNFDTFLYADDRRSLLEQSLAVLQPNLVHHIDPQLATMNAALQDLAKNVSSLREELIDLLDGQDEALAVRPKHLRGVAVGETEDKPEATPDPEAEATPDPKAGAKAAAKAKAKPRAKPEPDARSSTLLDGPEAVREERPTSLGDPAEIAAAQQALPWWRRPSR